MEILPGPPLDFNFHSTASSPYTTAPSSPQPFGHNHRFYDNLSAPTSPTQSSPINNFFRQINRSRKSLSAVPFDWEEKPGVPKHRGRTTSTEDGEVDDDFEFDFSGQLDARASASADELFDGGKIRPLKLPPRLQVGSGDNESASLTTSPRTPRSRFSPKKKPVQTEDFDPFAKALEETRKTEPPFQQREQRYTRGRDRNLRPSSSSTSSNYFRRGTRSLSPLRVSDIVLDEEANKGPSSCAAASTQAANSVNPKPDSSAASYFSSLLSSISFTKGYRKWSFRDFLLFRSASEGRGTSRDPLRKYTALSRKAAIIAEDAKSCSFRSTDSAGSSISRSSRRSRSNLSAHEIHYTENRAVSEEMRKKTFLPYKQGLLGCLGFNPGVNELARGIGSMASRS
ncbi:uncharacterized protein LOC116194242 [Punica granatum]|uniref:Uncharacterized protein n=2 Tax=Punica granatum TaxID=22663 RepID=A0A218X3D9_PUNGR|nr:uncharacterized protein LOC116194242 [Punica granatum]OWM79236.1 hypothetical protein CDL15_Pgr003408 [Punica granatum]PKI39254.1 hypothetical protein CRG98_040310 [Punica granatum]